jgi:hypothetical protein
MADTSNDRGPTIRAELETMRERRRELLIEMECAVQMLRVHPAGAVVTVPVR